MPHRKTPLVTEQIYHVFNRSVARQPIFLTDTNYKRALSVLEYYNFSKPSLRFSHFNRLPLAQKDEFLKNLKNSGKPCIELLAFCFMPNHVHFLIKEIMENGISTFMRNFQNSYAKYFNLKTDRTGTLFQAMFKAVRIETDEQLLHIARYIHLNPITSFVLKDIEELMIYPWSSFPVYLGKQTLDILNTEMVLNFFPSLKHFIDFNKDQISYQRELNRIKHLLLE